jgi:hypothetical protein
MRKVRGMHAVRVWVEGLSGWDGALGRASVRADVFRFLLT